MTTTTVEAAALAAALNLPATNVAGDPLTTCPNHPERIHYAVAEFGDQRHLCAECRETAPSEPASIAHADGSPADARVTASHIGSWILASCGARDLVKDDPNGLLMFRVGPNGKRVCKVLVRLMPNDTYAVEYGFTDLRPSRLSDPTWGEWQMVEQARDVYAEQLGETVRRLGDRDRY